MRVNNAEVLVLQVTVMHSMQAGYLEKAQKYTDKALMQLEKLKSKLQQLHICLWVLLDFDDCWVSGLFTVDFNLDSIPALSCFDTK